MSGKVNCVAVCGEWECGILGKVYFGWVEKSGHFLWMGVGEGIFWVNGGKPRYILGQWRYVEVYLGWVGMCVDTFMGGLGYVGVSGDIFWVGGAELALVRVATRFSIIHLITCISNSKLNY